MEQSPPAGVLQPKRVLSFGVSCRHCESWHVVYQILLAESPSASPTTGRAFPGYGPTDCDLQLGPYSRLATK